MIGQPFAGDMLELLAFASHVKGRWRMQWRDRGEKGQR